MKKLVLIFTMVVAFVPHAIGQRLGIDALYDKYPLLMNKFHNEIQQQKAAYFFVIDVSGSMNQYKPIVEPALKEFFQSLQDGDYVDVIRFGEEAEKANGCFGDISSEKKVSLCRNVDNIYFKGKPTDSELKRRFWNNTNLANAIGMLADEMHQLGLTNADGSQMMKFVFLITDFEHEPAMKGNDNWEKIKRRLENEHEDELVKIVALQLPGKATHFEQVRNTFPEHFSFKPQPVADGPALNSWFTDLKNQIMHERFKMLVLGKVKDANIKLSPSVNINGYMTTKVLWSPNELFDSFSITSLYVDNPKWSLNNFAPVTIYNDSVELPECKLVYKNKPLFPIFSSLHSNIVAEIKYNDSLMTELKALLGDDAPSASIVTAETNKSIFSHHLTLGWSIFVLVLLLLYFIMIFVAMSQNRAGRINGTFYVAKDGLEVTDRKIANGQNKIAIGSAAPFLPVPDCQWIVEISEKKVPVLIPILHFQTPSYKILMLRGTEYTVAGKRHRKGTSVKINRLATVIADKEYYIHWINK